MEVDGDAVKQTSDRVSRIAARVMKLLGKPGQSAVELLWLNRNGDVMCVKPITSYVRTLAASCLSQDETKGPRRRKKARK